MVDSDKPYDLVASIFGSHHTSTECATIAYYIFSIEASPADAANLLGSTSKCFVDAADTDAYCYD